MLHFIVQKFIYITLIIIIMVSMEYGAECLWNKLKNLSVFYYRCSEHKMFIILLFFLRGSRRHFV